MLVVSETIKNAYNQYTTQRKSYIQVGNNSFFIQNLDLQADCYDEGNIVGNAISKIAKFDIETDKVSGIDEFELFDGIWTGNQYEYISLGTFKLFEEQGTDDFFSSITAYDKLVHFNKTYDNTLVAFPTTVYGLLESICSQASIELFNTEITNGTKILDANLFVEGETLKQILKAICQISGCFAIVSNDKLKLLLKNSDSFTLNNNQISEPEYKRTTWKINQVVLGMKDVEGEYVIRQDADDIAKNGVHKIVINDNPFVYTQDLRSEYIDELFEQLKGFGYIAFESKWESFPFVEIGDQVVINGNESIVLRYNLKSPNGLESTISAPSIIDSVVDYIDNSSSIENRLRHTEISVNKQKGEIVAVTKTTEEITNNLDKNYYSVEQTNELLQKAESGLTNTFSTLGGENIFKNTGLFFGSENEYDYWNGNLKKVNKDGSATGTAMSLQKGIVYQELEVPNGQYSVRFKYEKINPLANCTVKYNGRTIELTNDSGTIETTGEITNKAIKIEFECDTNDGFIIYELMMNLGEKCISYTQNMNELRTDTVNISKGISVESNATNTVARIDSDGFRVVNKTNESVIPLKATDEGVETPYIKADKGNIAKLSIIRVDNQVWLTGE